jgi:hypothetical protein
MDLGTVKTKLLSNQYNTTSEVASDVRQVWINCWLYNEPNAQVCDMAEVLSAKFEHEFASTIMHHQITAPSSSSSSEGKNAVKLRHDSAPLSRLPPIDVLRPNPRKNDPICGMQPFTFISSTTPFLPPPPVVCVAQCNGWTIAFCEKEDGPTEADSLLLCDGPCLRSFHLACIDLKALPTADTWVTINALCCDDHSNCT